MLSLPLVLAGTWSAVSALTAIQDEAQGRARIERVHALMMFGERLPATDPDLGVPIVRSYNPYFQGPTVRGTRAYRVTLRALRRPRDAQDAWLRGGMR